MPFFLSSSPHRKSATRKPVVKDKTKASASNPLPYGPAVLWLCLGLAVGAMLGTGWIFARKALRNQLTALAPVPSGKGSVVLTVPPWISPGEARSIVEEMETLLSSSPLDNEGLDKAKDALERRPAVGKDHVRRIWRGFDGRVQLDVHWYEPAGIVVGNAGSPLSVVDIKGHLLAENLPVEAADRLTVPRIEGVDSPAPDSGMVWQNGRLQAGLKMLSLFSSEDRRRITNLRVGELDSKKRLKLSFLLKTPQNTLDITWGLPVGEEAGIDAPAESKQKALYGLCRDKRVQNGQAGSSHFSICSGRVTVTDLPPPTLPPQAGNSRKP